MPVDNRACPVSAARLLKHPRLKHPSHQRIAYLLTGKICFPVCCPTCLPTCWLIACLLIGMVVCVTADCHADLQERGEMAGGASSGAPHLYHTMSALVSQRQTAFGQTTPRPQAPGMHVKADLGIIKSPAGPGHDGSSPRLTEALLASAAAEVRSSAEKLPVSHRLPVSRSVFDSDEGETTFGPTPSSVLPLVTRGSAC